MGEFFMERFELLETQVKNLNFKLTESAKWQSALEKWLRNTFKLDVCELISNDEAEAAKQRAGQEDYTSCTPTEGTLKRKFDRSSHRPEVNSISTKKFHPNIEIVPNPLRTQPGPSISVSGGNDKGRPVTKALTASATITPVSVDRLRDPCNSSHRARPLDPPTVSITTIPNSISHDPQPNFNSSKSGIQSQILILPSETVTSSSFLNSTENEEADEEPVFKIQEYNTEMLEVEPTIMVKDEPGDLDDTHFSVTHVDPAESHPHFSRTALPQNDDLVDEINEENSHSNSAHDEKFEVDDFYMFNIQGGHSDEMSRTSGSNSYTPNQNQHYENYSEGQGFPAHYIKSGQGYAQLAHNGYIFCKEKGRSKFEKIFWKCSWYKKTGCRSRCHTLMDEIICEINAHNHPPEPDKILQRETLPCFLTTGQVIDEN